MYQLPPLPEKKKKKPRPAPRKSDAVKELERLYMDDHRRRYPSMPEYARTCKQYEDRTANGLTRCAIDYIRLTGGMAERVNCTGRYIDNSQVFEDVLGRKRSIGTGQWLPTSGMKGTADISAVIQGRAVKIEIKMKDRQSEDQKKYQAAVEQAGGIYLIIRSFQGLYDWYQSFGG
ncbi:MAG: hypothetical protein WAW07_15700 [Bacteroidales bacterium]